MLQYILAANETERECFSAFESPSTLRMGLLLYAKGGTDRWQCREGYKCKKWGGWYSYLYSAPYLTLTAGDKGIKCPSESPKQCRKGPLGAPPFAMMAILSASHAFPGTHGGRLCSQR